MNSSRYENLKSCLGTLRLETKIKIKGFWKWIFIIFFCLTMIFLHLSIKDITTPLQILFIFFAVWSAYITGMASSLFGKKIKYD
ncbi:MAG: hypothetical protein GPJ50_11450 [Candidatus Heimdallarchaeota archaeon]|nr:hypothetical protein [Candidatus Heimdallarchaeota archaeon]